MKLLKLLSGLKNIELKNFKNLNISNISLNSKELEKNGLFFAINGQNYNGEMFVGDAVKNGAVAVVCEKNLEVDVPQIIVENVRLAMSLISKNFFHKSDEKLKIIGVVGTNGKTTTATMIYEVLKCAGKKVGLIGTNGVMIGEIGLPSVLTTPDPIEMHYIFEQMIMFGIEYCVMEISAQAMHLHKMAGVNPSMLVFTNITPEHLDYFGSMENYANTKINYILSHKNANIIINSDDEYGRELLKKIHATSYGIFNPADVFALDVSMTLTRSKFLCNAFDDVFEVNSSFVGEYNVYNMLACISVCKLIGINTKLVQKGLLNLKKVDGRWEVFDFKNNNKVIVDYAHTPDGFEKVLNLVKMLRKGRIITLFGCVGYSNAEKRKQMGDIVKKYSDFSIITSDNLSDRDFDKMFREIGIKRYYAKIEDRAKAVEFGMHMLDKNDTLILLGKGAETVQKTMNGDEKYSEVNLVKEYQKRDSVG